MTADHYGMIKRSGEVIVMGSMEAQEEVFLKMSSRNQFECCICRGGSGAIEAIQGTQEKVEGFFGKAKDAAGALPSIEPPKVSISYSKCHSLCFAT